MLHRSLGAGSFSDFWKYWNPIWGYYLGKYIFKPTKKLLPSSLSLIITFAVSGLLHDVIIMLLRWDIAFIFTPWFTLMSIWILLSEFFKIKYPSFKWWTRAIINLLIVSTCFLLSSQLASIIN